jgi:hypothetical protein
MRMKTTVFSNSGVWWRRKECEDGVKIGRKYRNHHFSKTVGVKDRDSILIWNFDQELAWKLLKVKNKRFSRFGGVS